MIKTRLLRVMGKSLNLEVLQEIIWHTMGLLAHLVLVGCLAIVISDIYYDLITIQTALKYAGVVILCIFTRLFFIQQYFKTKADVSREATGRIRHVVLDKILGLGNSYVAHISNMRIAEILTEGADLIEVYYRDFLDSLGYAFLGTAVMISLLFLLDMDVAVILLVSILVAIVVYVIIDRREDFLPVKYVIAVLECLSYVGAAIGLTTSIKNFASGKMQLQWAIILFYICLEALQPMIELGKNLPDGAMAAASVNDIVDFLETKEPKEGKAEIEDTEIRIAMNEVAYAINKNTVLESVSLQIKAGNLVGIFGSKGAGKTTLAGIITKRNRAYKGSVKINGKELSSISQEKIYDAITYISDKSYVFPNKIRENLLIANPKLSEKRMVNALMVVKLWGELKDKGGLDYSLEENKLTKEQKTKLIMARALLTNSKVFIFDNVTSDLEEQTKVLIIKLIKQISTEMGKTVILLSENVDDLKFANTIYKLEDGTVEEYGKITKNS